MALFMGGLTCLLVAQHVLAGRGSPIQLLSSGLPPSHVTTAGNERSSGDSKNERRLRANRLARFCGRDLEPEV